MIPLRRNCCKGTPLVANDNEYRQLRHNPELTSRIVRTLLEKYFPSTIHADILNAVGLSPTPIQIR